MSRGTAGAAFREWEHQGVITTAQKDDILYLVDHASFDLWRPLVYVIPRAPVASRLEEVPMSKRAGVGVEYIIPDLQRTEFDIIEW